MNTAIIKMIDAPEKSIFLNFILLASAILALYVSYQTQAKQLEKQLTSPVEGTFHREALAHSMTPMVEEEGLNNASQLPSIVSEPLKNIAAQEPKLSTVSRLSSETPPKNIETVRAWTYPVPPFFDVMNSRDTGGPAAKDTGTYSREYLKADKLKLLNTHLAIALFFFILLSVITRIQIKNSIKQGQLLEKQVLQINLLQCDLQQASDNQFSEHESNAQRHSICESLTLTKQLILRVLETPLNSLQRKYLLHLLESFVEIETTLYNEPRPTRPIVVDDTNEKNEEKRSVLKVV